MPRQSMDQKETIERVMHEFKHGELTLKGGKKVRSPRQAIAIALHEAGASKSATPRNHREIRETTKDRERWGDIARAKAGAPRRPAPAGAGRTRAELYAEARRRDISGRSTMTKDELERALRR